MNNSLQHRVYSLTYEPRQIKATEEVLDKLYEGSKLGLQAESLAYHAGLTLSEYNQLFQLDARAEHAVIAGKADAEVQLAKSLNMSAFPRTFEKDGVKHTIPGDPKIALEILKHKHGWQTTQTIKNEHTGANGGPITMAAVDFRGLTNEELQQMKQILQKAAGGEQ